MIHLLEAPARFLFFTPLALLFGVLSFVTDSYRRWMRIPSTIILLLLAWWLWQAMSGRIMFFALPDGFFYGLLIFFVVWSLVGRVLTHRSIHKLFKAMASRCRDAILSPLPPEEDTPLQPMPLVNPDAEKVEYIAQVAPEPTNQVPTPASAFQELPEPLRKIILNG